MPRTRLTNLARSRALGNKASAKPAASRNAASSTSRPEPVPLSEDLPPPPPAVAKYAVSRMKRAERHETKDIVRALRDVKSYRGGFTKPTTFRTTNWFKGGPYVIKRKVYEPPEPKAYKPYTVFYLEGRYPVRGGHGRADHYPIIIALAATKKPSNPWTPPVGLGIPPGGRRG
ncbi:hypothetical protein NUW54_g14550 [Trametes sanguinea]|uniref:Uncharacterized protein n=1 Tax=Trametes sanguinea TaxID=158606 RepID=A0ACC1MCJ6_9APHY|nr:hypothetical protein NUW54_g14550 [Trametes sanguinea]